MSALENSSEAAGIPDSKLARDITEYILDREPELLFNHSSRVYKFGALAGVHRAVEFDHDMLYASAMFHDLGLVPGHRSQDRRFEVDGAFAARDFLREHEVADEDASTVWTAIALHTTPGIPNFMQPVVALLTAGVEMDVLGIGYDTYSATERNAVTEAFPRPPHFKEEIIQAFYDGIKDKPETTFGNVKADVIADKDPHFHAGNFCQVIRNSAWQG